MNGAVTQWITELAFHQLWLGAFLASGIWLAIRMREQWSAESRYWLWLGTLAVVAALPLLMIVPKAQWGTEQSLAMQLVHSPKDGIVAAVTQSSRAASDISRTEPSSPGLLSATLVFAWLLGMAWRFTSIARGLIVLRRWRRVAAVLPPISGFDGLDIRESVDVATPMVVGVLKPCVLLPAGLRDRLTSAQLALVLSHEQAHVRRRDPLLALAQRLIGAVYFYNPLIHWMSRQIDRERECSCDDRAIGETRQNDEAYASSLLAVARHVVGVQTPAEAIGAIGRPSQLKLRIERLLGRKDVGHTRVSWFAVGSTTTALLVAALLLSPGIPLAQTVVAATGFNNDSSGTNTIATRAMGRVLVEAVQGGDIQEVRDLIAAGADVNFPVHGDGTALIVAARHGNQRLVELLLNSGADVNRAVRHDGNALIAASGRGDLSIVTLLVEHGADVNAYVPGDETPLINAARRGRLDIVNYLVARGADVNQVVHAEAFPGSETRTALSEARKHGQGAVVERLRELGASNNVIRN